MKGSSNVLPHSFNEEIKKKLSEYYRNNLKCEMQEIENIKIYERGFSTTATFDVGTTIGKKRLFWKKVRHQPINERITRSENQALVEYDILDFLWPRFRGITGCSVPRPIAVLPESETVIMEFIEGSLLEEHMDRSLLYGTSRSRFREVKQLFFLAGSWLKHFQEFTDVGNSKEGNLDSIHEKIETRLNFLEISQDPRVPKGIKDRVLKYVQTHTYPYADNIRLTGRHGDFGPWNIMVRGDEICVIDFMGYRSDLPALDPLKMLSCFDTMRSRFAFNKRRIDELEQSFLSGFGEIPYTSVHMLKLCRIYHLVCNIYACVSNPGSNPLRRIERNIELKKSLYALYNLMHHYLYYVRP